MRALVRYTINGVEITGVVMGQGKAKDGRWLYHIHQVSPDSAAGLDARLYFSEFEIVRASK